MKNLFSLVLIIVMFGFIAVCSTVTQAQENAQEAETEAPAVEEAEEEPQTCDVATVVGTGEGKDILNGGKDKD